VKQQCAYCGSTKFGLARYRRGFRVFCKKSCRDSYRTKEFLEEKKRQSWFDYLMRPS
jgi:hypothetical protein